MSKGMKIFILIILMMLSSSAFTVAAKAGSPLAFFFSTMTIAFFIAILAVAFGRGSRRR